MYGKYILNSSITESSLITAVAVIPDTGNIIENFLAELDYLERYYLVKALIISVKNYLAGTYLSEVIDYLIIGISLGWFEPRTFYHVYEFIYSGPVPVFSTGKHVLIKQGASKIAGTVMHGN